MGAAQTGQSSVVVAVVGEAEDSCSEDDSFAGTGGVAAACRVCALSQSGSTIERYREETSFGGVVDVDGGGVLIDESVVDEARTKLILLRLMPAPKTRWSWSGRK
jgi:hypothetical protein